MDIIARLIEHSGKYFEAIIWYRIMTTMMDRKYTKRYYVIAATMIVLLLIVKTYVFAIPSLSHLRVFGTLVVIAYTFIAGLLLFNNSFFEKLIWWGIYYLGLVIMELIAVSIVPLMTNITLEQIQTVDYINNRVTFVTKIITLMAFELFIRFRKGKFQINKQSYRYLNSLIIFNIILFLGCVIVYYNLTNSNADIETIIIGFYGVVLITNVVSFILVFRIEKASIKEVAIKLKLAQIEMELKQNNEMISITDSLRKLRHDMNNHIGLIRNLVHNENYADLKEYVDQLYGDVEIANDFIISENRILSVLLNSKQSKARELNIDFQSIIAASDLKMQEKDICTLLGNILDNALEAAQKASGKKFVDFSIQKTESGCVIHCENSYGIAPVIKKGIFTTSKEDKKLHGIGTENIKDIVAKYHGEVRFDFDEDVFTTRVVLPV